MNRELDKGKLINLQIIQDPNGKPMERPGLNCTHASQWARTMCSWAPHNLNRFFFLLSSSSFQCLQQRANGMRQTDNHQSDHHLSGIVQHDMGEKRLLQLNVENRLFWTTFQAKNKKTTTKNVRNIVLPQSRCCQWLLSGVGQILSTHLCTRSELTSTQVFILVSAIGMHAGFGEGRSRGERYGEGRGCVGSILPIFFVVTDP